MSAHMAYAHRTLDVNDGVWRVACPADGCGYTDVATSMEHADWLADEHYRTACTCWRSDLLEWWPDGCNLPAHREAAAS